MNKLILNLAPFSSHTLKRIVFFLFIDSFKNHDLENIETRFTLFGYQSLLFKKKVGGARRKKGFKYLLSVRHVSEQYILKRNCGAVTELLNPLDVIVAQTTLC